MNRNWLFPSGGARAAISWPLLLLCVATGVVSAAAPAAAQELDGRVALPGQLRLDLGAEYLRADSRFGFDRANDPWGLNGPLGPDRVAAVATVAEGYETFLAETGGVGSGPGGADLSAGDLALEAVASSRVLPIRLALGILTRLEIGVGATVVRSQRFVPRFDVTGGNIGLNPDPESNRAVLAPLALTGDALGAGPLLPLADSPAGELLQSRVSATGATVQLPTVPVTLEELSGLGFERPPYDQGSWQVGDLELDGRLQLLRSFEGHLPPPGRTADWRLTASGSYRFPLKVGQAADIAEPDPRTGFSGFSAGLVGDLFVGERFWASAGGSVVRLEREEEEPSPSSDWAPAEIIALAPLGDEVNLWITPRMRLTDQLAIGANLTIARRGAADDVEGLDNEARTLTEAGLSIRYSNLVPTGEADPGRQWDAAAGFVTPLSGGDGAVRSTRVFVRLSILQRLWGGGREPVTPP